MIVLSGLGAWLKSALIVGAGIGVGLFLLIAILGLAVYSIFTDPVIIEERRRLKKVTSFFFP